MHEDLVCKQTKRSSTRSMYCAHVLHTFVEDSLLQAARDRIRSSDIMDFSTSSCIIACRSTPGAKQPLVWDIQ